MQFDIRGILGCINGPSGVAATDATVQALVIPPYPGPQGSGPTLIKPTPPNKQFTRGITHVTRVSYTMGDTAFLIYLARPFNYTYLTTAIAANGTSAVCFDDPGIYSTNYKYPCPGGIPGRAADNGIAANDYVAIQLLDGTFHVSKVTSVSTFTLTLTTALPNNGIGAAIGAPVYFFGQVTTDLHPITGWINPNYAPVVSTVDSAWTDSTAGIMSAFNPGDPLLFYSPNTTHKGTLNFVTGFYAAV